MCSWNGVPQLTASVASVPSRRVMMIGLSAVLVAGAGKFMWIWSPAWRRGMV